MQQCLSFRHGAGLEGFPKLVLEFGERVGPGGFWLGCGEFVGEFGAARGAGFDLGGEFLDAVCCGCLAQGAGFEGGEVAVERGFGFAVRLPGVQPRGTTPDPTDHREDLGVIPGGSAVEGFLVAAQAPCDYAATQDGPLSPACMSYSHMFSTWNGVSYDQAAGLCAVVEGTLKIHTLCEEDVYTVPAGIATRQIDLVSYSDMEFCALSVPADGSTTSLADLVERALDEACAANSQSGWDWSPGGPAAGCETPSEAAQGNFDLIEQGKLPIGTATYRFVLPAPSRDVVMGINFSYRAENAVIFVAMGVGPDAIQGDGPQGGLLVAGDPSLSLTPALQTTGRTGSARIESGFLSSSNPQTGYVTFVAIPTAWVSAGPVNQAHVELCNLGVETTTFAKLPWLNSYGAPFVSGASTVPITATYFTGENALLQTDPSNCRARERWNTATKEFDPLGSECEEIQFAVQVPKNNLTAGSCIEPCDDVETMGDASYFHDVKTPAGASILSSIPSIYDPGLGITPFDCDTSDPTWGPACTAGGSLGRRLDFFDGLRVNGRFFATLPIPDAAVRSAGGEMFVYIKNGTGSHAKPFAVDASSNRISVFGLGTAYDALDGLNQSSNDILDGWISIENGSILTIRANPPIGGEHIISTDLNCVTVDGTTVCP